MEAIQITRYKCGTCGSVYDSETSAKTCESRRVTQDKGVKVGDQVRITAGDGDGKTATVSTRFVIDKDWGHHQWHRYWHTVGLTAKIDGGPGTRMLTFDCYETAQSPNVEVSGTRRVSAPLPGSADGGTR